jgi:hypothetical protein
MWRLPDRVRVLKVLFVGKRQTWQEADRGSMLWRIWFFGVKAQRFCPSNADTVVLPHPAELQAVWSRRGWRTTSSPSWRRRLGAPVPLGIVLLISPDMLEPYLNALCSWRGCSRQPPILYTPVLAVSRLDTCCLRIGSALHGPEREGGWPIPDISWWVWCDEVKWFHK